MPHAGEHQVETKPVLPVVLDKLGRVDFHPRPKYNRRRPSLEDLVPDRRLAARRLDGFPRPPFKRGRVGWPEIRVWHLNWIQSVGIGGIVTLTALQDDARVRFETTSSTFHGLSAQADDGVEIRHQESLHQNHF